MRLSAIPLSLAVLVLPFTAVAEEAAKNAAPAEEPVIVGNPPADHPFGKLKIGMTAKEALAIVGQQPTSQNGWCTGKHRIPFYSGADRGRIVMLFKGMGQLDFNAGISMGMFGRCSSDEPLDLIYIEYKPDSTGELDKG
ncbi:MAG: hypothetical protein LWW83_02105 [Azonexaceae bacterium]|uniref:hypothetical protein n=1 Tax=Azonexus sp. R2A61 TaxID=2744443 RepID=UPI001F3E0DEB|nr:hypothetical protein [Azonexus sp. R2A61]MCE1238706.1 hypothetical protein [Azonexaceae bacterium]